ncbi:aminotransferase [Carbonactinospora thermoautotrophica]|uniref:cysteine desulfurase family protein n=1 Tax=Carbonactinospora thermoautotrophica TaxID=1469144 RepID=UPI0022721C2F|nr:cysteine desulfurase family protein [Carbonactinospora thermoautotrophica]MCX9193853.1 aminotransferase [Carbonactinospora thermoautotrophica]
MKDDAVAPGRGEPVVYLDYNATAPLRPEALAAMLPILRSVGNAASPHALGRQAAESVEVARRQLADLLGCSPGELIFTSGATEANNLALQAAIHSRGRLITSAVEHPAVLETARALANESRCDLVVLGVDEDGIIDLDALHQVLQPRQPSLVSIMAANNETGVLTDLERVVDIAHEAGALVHTDATQLIGRLPVDLSTLDVDMLSLSAHKFGGPQGVGALFIRRGLNLPGKPLLHGGGQERGWRAGTLNVAGIVGAGAAAAVARANLEAESQRIQSLRDLLEESLLTRVEETRVNGRRDRRLPNVSSLTFSGAPADAVLAAMPDVAASDGSACSSGAPTPSHVLLAMGRSREDAESTIRFSLGYGTTKDDIERAVEATANAVAHVRRTLGTAGAVRVVAQTRRATDERSGVDRLTCPGSPVERARV